MTSIIPRSPEAAKQARANPKQGRNPRPQPPMRCAASAPALPEPFQARDMLESLSETGVHWWSIIDSVLQAHEHCLQGFPNPREPLPQWAVDRLKDQGRHNESYKDHRRKANGLHEWLSIAEGSGSQYRFEIWTKNNHRLSLCHESLVEAAAALEQLKPKFPDAHIIRTSALWPSSYSQTCENAELLNTLIGRVDHIGTNFGDRDEEARLTVQDETGRQVVAFASTLRQHPVFERLNKRGKEVIIQYLEHNKPRKAAAERKAGEQP